MAAAASLVGAIFTFLIVPRTKNKSLYELEILFKKSVDEQIDGGKLETNNNCQDQLSTHTEHVSIVRDKSGLIP